MDQERLFKYSSRYEAYVSILSISDFLPLLTIFFFHDWDITMGKSLQLSLLWSLLLLYIGLQ